MYMKLVQGFSQAYVKSSVWQVLVYPSVMLSIIFALYKLPNIQYMKEVIWTVQSWLTVFNNASLC